ncbi:hypothetical protein CL654_01845 [bacterium]|nr:hypothetical protein [bacterium]|tara:strand:+ start:7666 stop:8490 length:825 start_codon:yes stop_codon:yes gene_type:complete
MAGIHRSFRRNDPKASQRKKIFKILGGLLVVLVFGGIVWVTHLPSLSIQTVSVSGAEKINPQSIEETIEEELSSSYIGIFPKKNYFIYPKQNLLALLIEQEPYIESISISAPLRTPTSLEVSLIERNSNLVWCTNTGCNRLDEDGTIFGSVGTSTNEYFIVKKDGAVSKPLGEKVAMPETLLPLFTIRDSLKKDIAFKEGHIRSDNDYALITEVGTEVLFNGGDDLNVVADNLFTLFRSDVVKQNGTGTVAQWMEGIDYIDARFGKKIFYKEKE